MFLFYHIDWGKRNIVCVQFYQIYYYDVLVLPYRLELLEEYSLYAVLSNLLLRCSCSTL